MVALVRIYIIFSPVTVSERRLTLADPARRALLVHAHHVGDGRVLLQAGVELARKRANLKQRSEKNVLNSRRTFYDVIKLFLFIFQARL